MKCPIDGAELVITHRESVEIDYCPKCRGIWLDRGELDKIIDRSLQYEQPAQSAQSAPSLLERRENEGRKRHDDDDDYKHDKRKRKSFLEDLFDF